MRAQAKPPVPTWVRRLPVIAGVLAAALGVVALVALIDAPGWLPTLSPAALPPRAALMAAALGGALLLAAAGVRGRALGYGRWLLELGALVLAVLGAVEYFGDADLGLDASTPLSASLAFGLCALALLAERLHTGNGRGISRSLATITGLLALLALLGHLFGAIPLYRPLFADAPVTVLTALTIVLLGIGIVALHAEYGLPSVVVAPTLTGLQMRWSLLAAVVVPLAMGSVALRIDEAFPFGSISIALMAAGTTILLGAIVSVAALWTRRAEDRLELGDQALTAIPQGVFIVDTLERGHPNLYVNSAYSALTGVGAQEAVSPAFDAMAIFASDTHADALGAALADGNATRVVVRRRNGTVFSAKLALRSVPGDDGSRYYVGVIEDVTAEELAAKQRLELLAEAAQARSDAEAANRAKDTFFASLSHELRSPLNACVMWLDVLALGPEPDKVTKGVEAIRRNLGRQTRLVNDLIDAAKISSGGIEVHLEPIDLIALLEPNVDTWQLLAASKQLSFRHQFDVAVAYVDADSDRILQVLNNLVENAINNTPAGGRVEVRLHDAADASLVEVEDTGIGLSPEEAAHVFTPFWRAPGTRTHKGLGLGLAISHHLVTKHGGTLTAASPGPGAGAVFTITLPRAAAHERRHRADIGVSAAS